MRRSARYVMYGGVVAAVLGLSKIHARYVAPQPYSWHSSPRAAWSVAYIVVLCVAAYGVGLPDLVRGARSGLVAAVAAALGGALAMSAVQLVVGDALLPRFVVFGATLVLIPWFAGCAAMASGGRSRAQERDRVLLVDAAPDELMLLHRDLEGDAERPATVAATLSLDEARSTGSSSPLIDAVIAEGATVVVLSGAARLDESVVSQAATLHEGGVRIRTISLFYEEWMGKLPVAELERVSLMFDIGEVHRRRYARASRLVDLPIALAGVLTLVIATPFVLLGDLFANRGPLLYRQPRVGKDGKEFRILKFRTMRAERGESPNEWTRRDDPRITPFGQFMRTTHVDELPQFINILRGDLALVGPRPEQPHYVAELREKLPFYDLRHLVHPGLTGWAQVKYGYAGDERDALEKLQYEFFYLRHQSLMFDLRIMGRTVRSVLGRSGR